jgi:hypothetical protein
VFYIYLFSAVAGCLLVGVSMATAGHQGDGDTGDGEGGGEHPAALSENQSAVLALGQGQNGSSALVGSPAGGDGQAGHGLDAHDAGHGAAGHPALAGGLSAAALFFLSLQLWTYLLAFGGLTGLLLRTLAHVPEPTAFLCALSVGLGTALGARKVMRRLSASSDSGTVEQGSLVGTSAQVLVPAGAGATGKVRLVARGQTIDLMARAHDGGALPEHAEVILIDIKDGVAEVTLEMAEAGADASRLAVGRAALQKAPPLLPKNKG